MVDQVINSLVYGSFFEESTTLLKYFLVPFTNWWTSKSYLLWSLYSYLQLLNTYDTVIYVWQWNNTTPLLPADDGVEYVLGKRVDYDTEFLKKILGSNYKLISDFGIDNAARSQHMAYQSICGMKVIPLCLPLVWSETPEYRKLIKDMLISLKSYSNIACVLIDDFEIQVGDTMLDMVANRDSLSDLYNQFVQDNNQESHLLALQPVTDDEVSQQSRWVLWCS